MADIKHTPLPDDRHCQICDHLVPKYQGVNRVDPDNPSSLIRWHSQCYQVQQKLEANQETIRELVEALSHCGDYFESHAIIEVGVPNKEAEMLHALKPVLSRISGEQS